MLEEKPKRPCWVPRYLKILYLQKHDIFLNMDKRDYMQKKSDLFQQLILGKKDHMYKCTV